MPPKTRKATPTRTAKPKKALKPKPAAIPATTTALTRALPAQPYDEGDRQRHEKI